MKVILEKAIYPSPERPENRQEDRHYYAVLIHYYADGTTRVFTIVIDLDVWDSVNMTRYNAFDLGAGGYDTYDEFAEEFYVEYDGQVPNPTEVDLPEREAEIVKELAV